MAEGLSPEQTTALQKVCERASITNAEQCVSPISGKKVNVEVSSFSLENMGGLANLMESQAEVIIVCIPLGGGNKGDVLLALTAEKAAQLCDIFSGNPEGTTTKVDDYTESMIEEVGKLTMMAYVNALMQEAGSICAEGVPGVTSGGWQKLQKESLAEYSRIIRIGLNFSSGKKEDASGLKIVSAQRETEWEKPTDPNDPSLMRSSLLDFARVIKTGKIKKGSEENLRKASLAIAELVTMHPVKIKKAVKVLRSIGPDAVAPLVNSFSKGTLKARYVLVDALKSLGKPAVPALNEALVDSDPEVSMIIGKVLEHIKETPQDDGLEEIDGEEAMAQLLIAFQKNDMDRILGALRG